MKHLIFFLLTFFLCTFFLFNSLTKNTIENFTNVKVNINDNIFIIDELIITHKHNGNIIEKKTIKNPKTINNVNFEVLKNTGRHIFNLEYKNNITGSIVKSKTKVFDVTNKEIGISKMDDIIIHILPENVLQRTIQQELDYEGS